MEGLHRLNIIHKDIKTNNIIASIENNGAIKKCYIADFGVSLLLKNHNDLVLGINGTLFYRAPEVLKGTGHGIKSDIWSYGATLFSCLT